MSVSGIINPATGKIYDELAPQGGGVPLAKGGLITADAGGNEQPLPAGNNGWVLSANSGVNLGLEYIQLPAGGINFTQEGQLLYAGAGPAFADSLLNIGNAGQILGINAGIPAWINAGGSGTITALAPLTEYADGTASKVAVNFTGKGDLIVGGGVQVGGEPVAGVILPAGANDMVLTCNSGTASGLEWKASGGGSSATIFRNSQDNSQGYIATITKPITANDTCIIVADRTYNDFNTQIKNTTATAGTPIPAQAQGGVDFLVFQIPFDMTLTGFSGEIYLENTAVVPSQNPNSGNMNLNNQDQSQTLLGGDEMNWNDSGSFNVNFTATGSIFLSAGTNVVFNFGVDNLVGVSCNAIDTGGGVISGNLTITGVEYANNPVSFQISNGGKFRPSGDLTGKLLATCANFSSQTFVASADLNDWIVSGGVNAGVLFP